MFHKLLASRKESLEKHRHYGLSSYDVNKYIECVIEGLEKFDVKKRSNIEDYLKTTYGMTCDEEMNKLEKLPNYQRIVAQKFEEKVHEHIHLIATWLLSSCDYFEETPISTSFLKAYDNGELDDYDFITETHEIVSHARFLHDNYHRTCQADHNVDQEDIMKMCLNILGKAERNDYPSQKTCLLALKFVTAVTSYHAGTGSEREDGASIDYEKIAQKDLVRYSNSTSFVWGNGSWENAMRNEKLSMAAYTKDTILKKVFK